MTCEEHLKQAIILLREVTGLEVNHSGAGLLDYDFNWRQSDAFTEKVKEFLREVPDEARQEGKVG